MIFIQYPFHCSVKVLDLEKGPTKTSRIKEDIASILGYNEFSLLHNGKKLHADDVVPDNSTVHVSFSLPGGKGGFGSMLRAIGAQIEKTTNREACRDLSGRRLRDINEEQRLKKWISKEAEREADKIKRRKARIERLKTKAPHKFFDYEYEKEISELPDRVNDALSEGLQKAKQPKKRPHETSASEEIPKKSWMADFSGTSSESDSDEKNGDKVPNPELRDMAMPSCCQSMPEPTPGSSKDSDFTSEESVSSESKCDFREENCSDSNESGLSCKEEKQSVAMDVQSTSESNDDAQEKDGSSEKVIDVNNAAAEKSDSVVDAKELREKGNSEKESSVCTVTKEPEAKDDSPVELLDFQSVSELEALGLEKLKSALMMHGLKCGGTLSDRAQRLWKIRGLQRHEYPSNLLAKSKK